MNGIGIMCIFIGHKREQWIDVAIWHIQSVYELLKQELWNKLNQEEQEDLVNDFEYFEDVHLSDWQPETFKEAYQILMASENEFITPLRDDFERAFKIDPRFQS